MITKLLNKKQIFAFFPILFNQENPHDKPKTDEDKLITTNLDETGFDRLKKLFRLNNNFEVHPATISLLNSIMGSFLIGGIYGGTITSRESFINFIENNEATQFINQHQAKRQLIDNMASSFFKGMVKYGSRTSVFCTTFVATYTIISVYRNKDSVSYYIAAGMSAGSLYKFSLGFKGMIVGGVVGGLLGTAYAGLKYILLLAFNVTENDLRNRSYQSKFNRDELIRKNFQDNSIETSKKFLEKELKEN